MKKILPRQRWKLIVTIITFVALFGTVYLLREQIFETFQNLRRANPWPILLIIPLAALNHYFQGKVYQAIFRILGVRFRTRPMMRLSLEMNFVNNVFPSAGMSGFSYLSLRLRGEKIRAGQSTLVQVLRFALLFLSFQILLAVGLLLLAFSGQASNFVMLISGSLATMLLVGTVAVLYLISSKTRIKNFFTGFARALNRFIHVMRPRHPETISIDSVQRMFEDLHDNYTLIKQNVQSLKRPLWFALGTNIAEISAIFCVFFAFGFIVNPGAIIIAYAVANFAGIISILPGGVGIYEALMASVFAVAGVPASVSLPVIVTFRIISMSVQLGPGYFFYNKNLHASQQAEA
jgi:uncharacterized protein (TIRG00374 family)